MMQFFSIQLFKNYKMFKVETCMQVQFGTRMIPINVLCEYVFIKLILKYMKTSFYSSCFKGASLVTVTTGSE